MSATQVDPHAISPQFVWAHDEKEEIGSGTHARMVVDMRRLDERLAAKSKSKI